MTTNSPHVLIVSTSLDTATNEVASLLLSKGFQVTRLDTETHPFDCTLSWNYDDGPRASVTVDGIDVSAVSSVWYRRVRAPARPTEMNSGVYDFCIREARSALLGAIQSIDVPTMSPPEAVWRAEFKPFQLSMASRVGLILPRTVVTNDPQKVREAYQTFQRRMIVKPVRTGYVDYGTEQHAVYTSIVRDADLERVEDVRLSPAIFQEHVEKDCDIRVTVVGGRMFVAEIDSQSDPAAVVDWRKTKNPRLPHRRGELPQPVENALWSLMRNLGLVFGAIDLIRDKDGRYVFLEVNPSGQWLWIDDFLGTGITEAVAEWLIAPTR